MAVYVVPEAYRQWGAVSLMHETGEKCIEMPGPKNGTPLTRLLRLIVLERGAALRTRHFDALFVRFVH